MSNETMTGNHAPVAIIRHIRKGGHKIDRRFRMGGIHHRVSSGGTLCGATETTDDLERDNAKATLEHAAIYAKRGEAARIFQKASETAATMCPACVAALVAA